MIGMGWENLDQIYKQVRLPSGQPKGVGPKLRAALDKHYPGWVRQAPIDLPLRLVVSEGAAAYRGTPNDIERIPEYETGGRMGHAGLILRDQPGEIRGWEVTREWLRKNVPNCTAPGNLAIVTGFGDSMRPL